MKHRQRRSSRCDEQKLHSILGNVKLTCSLQDDRDDLPIDHANVEIAHFFAPPKTKSKGQLYHVLVLLTASSSTCAIQSNVRTTFKKNLIQTGSILSLHLTRDLARHRAKLKWLTRAASRGVTVTASMTITEWYVHFPASLKSFFTVGNLPL